MFATILLPNFYLQAIARHQPKLRDQPFAVLDDTAIKAVILQLNEAAENEGVRAGMTPSQALARCLHLVIKARARDCEQQISDILLHHAFMLSPFVEATAPGVCTVHFMQSCSRDCRSKQNPDALTENAPPKSRVFPKTNTFPHVGTNVCLEVQPAQCRNFSRMPESESPVVDV